MAVQSIASRRFEDRVSRPKTRCSDRRFSLQCDDDASHGDVRSDSGVKASIVAFQAVDPGSIPGCRTQPFGFQLACSTALLCSKDRSRGGHDNEAHHIAVGHRDSVV